jgi:hypothetical protein
MTAFLLVPSIDDRMFSVLAVGLLGGLLVGIPLYLVGVSPSPPHRPTTEESLTASGYGLVLWVWYGVQSFTTGLIAPSIARVLGAYLVGAGLGFVGAIVIVAVLSMVAILMAENT